MEDHLAPEQSEKSIIKSLHWSCEVYGCKWRKACLSGVFGTNDIWGMGRTPGICTIRHFQNIIQYEDTMIILVFYKRLSIP